MIKTTMRTKTTMNEADRLLERARTVLFNMAMENERKWWQFWIARWQINHEPLRGDARNVVNAIDHYLIHKKVG